MITKQELFSFITAYQSFEEAIERMEEAISGSKYGCNLFESDWVNSVNGMLDIFIESNFTESGSDLINWWLFEDVDHSLTETVDPDLFNGETKVEYDVNDLEDLWNYMIKFKKDYFKND